jgi:hypothetical protein
MSAYLDDTNPYTEMTLGPVDTGYAAYCAFSAYARLGKTDNAQAYADQALARFDRAGLPGRSFVRLELATALVTSDPSRAAQLAQSAIVIVAKEPVASIRPHIIDFLEVARSPKIQRDPAIRSAVDAARTLLSA